MDYANKLTEKEVNIIHKASLQLLENTGILVKNERARNIYKENGCTVDPVTGIVTFPNAVVTENIKKFVSTFTFHGRSEKFDCTIPDHSPVMVTASSAPFIIDANTGEQRYSNSNDIANIASLVNELSGYDIFSISTLAEDTPKGKEALSRLYPALKHCEKPVRVTTSDIAELKEILKLGEIVSGSQEEYNRRPFITHHYCPIVSPMTMDVDSTEALIYLTKEKLPVYGTISTNAGMTAPMDLSGALIQGNAEFLAMSILQQMIEPGTPLIYSVLATAADMRSGAYASGGIETAMLQMAHSQMAQYYNVPSGGYTGFTNAHESDTQAGAETASNTIAAVLAGADMLNMGGLYSAGTVFDFDKLIIDGELASSAKQMIYGMKIRPDNIQAAIETIEKVEHGGDFLNEKHTKKHMRDVYFPKTVNRGHRSRWSTEGKKNADDYARIIAREILEKDNLMKISAETDSAIRAEFPDLVTGQHYTI